MNEGGDERVGKNIIWRRRNWSLKKWRGDEWIEWFGGEPLIKPRCQGTTLSVDRPTSWVSTPNPQFPEILQFCIFRCRLPLQQQFPRYNMWIWSYNCLTDEKFIIAWNNWSCAWTYLVKWKPDWSISCLKQAKTDFGKLWLPIVCRRQIMYTWFEEDMYYIRSHAEPLFQIMRLGNKYEYFNKLAAKLKIEYTLTFHLPSCHANSLPLSLFLLYFSVRDRRWFCFGKADVDFFVGLKVQSWNFARICVQLIKCFPSGCVIK